MTRKGPAPNGLALRSGDKRVNTITQHRTNSSMQSEKVLWECVEKCRRLAQVCPAASGPRCGDPHRGNRSQPGGRGYDAQGRRTRLGHVAGKGRTRQASVLMQDFIRTGKGTGKNLGGRVEKHGREKAILQMRLDKLGRS